MAQGNVPVAGLRREGLEEVIRATTGMPRWRGCVTAHRGRLFIKVKNARGRWVERSTGTTDTPANRQAARVAIDALRAEYAGQPLHLPDAYRTNGRNSRNRSFKRRRGTACEVCGWTPKPPLRATAINAHHVRPTAEGGDHSDSNRLLLCPNHHAVAHALHRVRPARTPEELLSQIRAWEA